MSNLRRQLAERIADLGFSTWGVADVAGLHPSTNGFPTALSLGLGYGIPFEKYDEAAYHALTLQVKSDFDGKFASLVAYLEENSIRYAIPGAQQGSGNGLPVFPHKAVATRAGLGWIGKSTLLVTPDYGPRVRLGTILLADGLKADAPVTASQCDVCDRCVRACPNEAIPDRLWGAEVDTGDSFSVAACSKREAYVPTLGRKHSCGLCLLTCPAGDGGLRA